MARWPYWQDTILLHDTKGVLNGKVAVLLRWLWRVSCCPSCHLLLDMPSHSDVEGILPSTTYLQESSEFSCWTTKSSPLTQVKSPWKGQPIIGMIAFVGSSYGCHLHKHQKSHVKSTHLQTNAEKSYKIRTFLCIGITLRCTNSNSICQLTLLNRSEGVQK